jgi:hypothetical protein
MPINLPKKIQGVESTKRARDADLKMDEKGVGLIG